MRLLRVYEPFKVGIEDIPGTKVAHGRDLVRVKVHYVGLCGTDVSLFSGHLGLNHYPVIPGHEAVGVVLDSETARLPVGSHVALDPLLSCGICAFCLRGLPQYCSEVGVIGVVRDGALQTEITLSEKHWVRLPDALPLQVAVLVEPAHVCETVVAEVVAGIPMDGTVLVIGTGAMGLMMVKVLHTVRPDVRLIVHDVSVSRVERAVEFGGDSANDLGQDFMADIVIDGVGSSESMNLGTRHIGRGGLYVVYGVPVEGDYLPNVDVLFRKNVRISFKRLYNHDFSGAIKLLEDGIVGHEIITRELELVEAVDYLESGGWRAENRVGKVVVRL